MPISRCSRRTFLAAAAISPLAWGAPFWETKPFPNWTEEEARRLLIDSPWAVAFNTPFTWEKAPEAAITYKDVPGTQPGLPRANTTVPGGSPVGGVGAPQMKLPKSADLILRWASALPVKQAKAILLYGPEASTNPEARALVNRPERDYILEIFGLPAIVGHQGTGTLELVVRRGTVLRTRKGIERKPDRVVAEVKGLNILVQIHFSRENPLTEDDRELVCQCDTGLFKFRRQFDLRKMKTGEELAI